MNGTGKGPQKKRLHIDGQSPLITSIFTYFPVDHHHSCGFSCFVVIVITSVPHHLCTISSQPKSDIGVLANSYLIGTKVLTRKNKKKTSERREECVTSFDTSENLSVVCQSKIHFRTDNFVRRALA